MVEFARPALAAAGLLAALVPLVLHLIARRPRERTALPTARFLTPDERVAMRIRRRPTDLLLLALRILLLALAGVGLAGPTWHPDRHGTVEVVLLDRGRGMREGDAWRRAVDEARRRLVGADGEVRGDLVLFDTTAALVPARALTAAAFDSLASTPPTETTSDYGAALRGLASVGRGLRGADSARATLLTAARSDGWGPGLAAIRRAAWPGSLEVPPLVSTAEVASPVPSDEATRRGVALVVAGPDGGAYVTAALEATGWTVRRTAADAASVEAATLDDAALVVVLAAPSPEVARGVAERVRAGATWVSSADAPSGPLDSLLPWRTSADDGGGAGTGGAIWFGSALRLDGAATGVAGRPADGATMLAAWDDGRPAAVAARVGRGCAVVLGAPLEGGRLPLSAEYPRALDRLARGCEPDASPTAGVAGLPLDSGALALLRLADHPPVVAASAVAGPGGGVPLGRWLLAAALLVAVVETALAYGRRDPPSRGAALPPRVETGNG